MKSKFIAVLCVGVMLLFIIGCATSDESSGVKKGVGVGAAGGAVVGLAMGALTGDAGFAAAGAAAGAVAGGAAGGMYMYDQSRDDRRTQALADSIGGAKKGETADDAGKRHLGDFAGEWNLDIWALNADGSKITASGQAAAALTGKDILRIDHKNIKAQGFEQVFSGSSVVTYSPNSGFTIENQFSAIQGTRRFVGEYLPADNAYNFYPSQNIDGETVTGVIRSNVRIQLRASNPNLVVAETFAMVDGKEVNIQQ